MEQRNDRIGRGRTLVNLFVIRRPGKVESGYETVGVEDTSEEDERRNGNGNELVR